MQVLSRNFSEEPWWWQHARPFDSATREIPDRVDHLVIGSGYAGLSCAHELAREGAAVTVVEAGQIGVGASTRAAGFLSGRAGVSKQIDLEATVGAERARNILEEADTAYAFLEQLIRESDIDCDLERCGRYVGALTAAAYDKLAAKMAEYNSDGQDRFYMVSREEQHDYVGSDFWYGGMFTDDAGSIHPSKYHAGLVKLCRDAGVEMISDCAVTGMSREDSLHRVETSRGVIHAGQVVIATNGYTGAVFPWHRQRIIPISSTMAACEPLGEERVREILPKLCPVIDTRRVICFARPTPDRQGILFGGRARFAPVGPERSAEILHGQLVRMFPQLQDVRVTHAWSGLMGFTFDFLPRVGTHEGVHYAIGCNGGCGIVMMSWLGRQAAQKILGTAERSSAFEGLPFRTQKFYTGKPWFLPIVGNYYRFRDWLEIRGREQGLAATSR